MPKTFKLQGASSPWSPDQGLCPWTPLGSPPPDPLIGSRSSPDFNALCHCDKTSEHDFFGFGHLDGLGSRGGGATDNYNFDIPWGPKECWGAYRKSLPRGASDVVTPLLLIGMPYDLQPPRSTRSSYLVTLPRPSQWRGERYDGTSTRTGPLQSKK